MLKKLLKYDLKAINKYFIPMSIFFLAYSLIGTLFFQIENESSKSELHHLIVMLIITAFIIMIIAYSIITQGLIVVNFFKSMVTDTGYLTHTLPVKKSALIISKTLASIITLIISGIVMLLCLIVFLDLPRNFSNLYPDIVDFVHRVTETLGTGVTIMTVITFLFLILACLLYIISLYFVSIAFGQLINRHKIIGSLLSYFVLTLLLQIISTITLSIIGHNITIDSIEALKQINTAIIPLYLGGCILFETLLSIGFLFLTNWIFSKKLNLD